ncbi:hypothetical protein BgiBS90_033674, partial [Biomphalaria glabrata]
MRKLKVPGSRLKCSVDARAVTQIRCKEVECKQFHHVCSFKQFAMAGGILPARYAAFRDSCGSRR